MQNPYVKYLKTKNGYFYLFYYEHGNIFCRSFSHDGWTVPQKIAEKASPVFSVCQYEAITYLLYSGGEGQLYLASSADFANWEHRPLRNGTSPTDRTRFFLLPSKEAFHIIYHLPTEATGVDSLVYSVFRNGQWEKPYQIDRFLSLKQTPFLARRLSDAHIILYYRTGRNVLSAREMLLTPYTIGSVTPLIQTPTPCTDLSIINDTERIHILYIVRNMFRTQVVYQYKHTVAISTPRILWEDTNCENCLAYQENGRLILMWTANGQPFRCISENGGASFGAVERYMEKFPAYCIKGELLGANDAALNAAECYGNGQHGFLPAVFAPSPLPEAPKAAKQAEEDDYSKAYTALQASHKKQIEEFSVLLEQRSDEIAAVNARWKTQLEKMEQELSALRMENAQLRQSSLPEQAENPDFLHTKSPPYVFCSRRLFLSFLFGCRFVLLYPSLNFSCKISYCKGICAEDIRIRNHCANPCNILHIHALNLRRIGGTAILNDENVIIQRKPIIAGGTDAVRGGCSCQNHSFHAQTAQN